MTSPRDIPQLDFDEPEPLIQEPIEPEIDLCGPWDESFTFRIVGPDRYFVLVLFEPQQSPGLDRFAYAAGGDREIPSTLFLPHPISQRGTYANPQACAEALLAAYLTAKRDRDAWRESLRGKTLPRVNTTLLHNRWAKSKWAIAKESEKQSKEKRR